MMQKRIELVLVQDEVGVFFGLCDGSAPPVAISAHWPAKTGHDVALNEFAGLVARAVLGALTARDQAPALTEGAAPAAAATAG